MIRFDNFNIQYAAIKSEIDAAVQRVLDSGWFILGKEVEAFESEFSQYIGCKYCVGVASGTDALALSLMALGIGHGHEVITTDLTAFPTITAIMQAGAVPVTVDISYEDGLMAAGEIEKHITPRTRAIIPVHLYGQSCDMNEILAIAKKHGLEVVEDCAQSVGATYRGQVTGSLGTLGAFSFYPTKNLGAYGDGGAITTNDEALFQKLRQLRNYGQADRYHHRNFGLNSRLDEIQAAILRTKLHYLDEWNDLRWQHAAYYHSHLDKNVVGTLKEHDYGKPVYHLFVIQARPGCRDGLTAHLKDSGIQCLIHYPVPAHSQGAFPQDREINEAAYVNARQFAGDIVSIPVYPELSIEDREKIVQTVGKFTAGS